MKRNLYAALLLLVILLLFGSVLFLTLRLENITSSILQILVAIAFVTLLSLLHRVPARWVSAIRRNFPFSLITSRWLVAVSVLSITVVSLLVLNLTTAFNAVSIFRLSAIPKLEAAPQSEYLIPVLDSFNPGPGQVGSLEDMRSKYLLDSEYSRNSDDRFRNAVLKQSALVACAVDNYGLASEFVTAGLKLYPDDKGLLAMGGLIAYEQSSYAEALASFQQALRAEPQSATSKEFQAAMLGNIGLACWHLGQTREAEDALARSLNLFGNDDATREESYLLIKMSRLYTDYWQLANASATSNRVLALAGRMELGLDPRDQRANVSRQNADIALVRGDLDLARQEVDRAIGIHSETQGLQYLAQDYEVKAAIQEQSGLYDEALDLLGKAAGIYKELKYNKEESENSLKQANVLLNQAKYQEAQSLIKSAGEEFSRIGYRRGEGEASALEGELLRKRASSKDINKGRPQLVVAETRKAFEKYQKAYDIFQDIGYARGIAYANNLLGVAVVQINKPIGGDTSDEDFPDEAFYSAKQYYDRAALLYMQIGDRRGESNVFGNLGNLYRLRKDYDLAFRYLNEALGIHQEIGFELGIARQLINIGRLYCKKGDLVRGRQSLLLAREKLATIQGAGLELTAVDKLLDQECR